MNLRAYLFYFSSLVMVPISSLAQHEHHQAQQNATVKVEPQPFLAHAIRLNDALSFLGSALSKEDQQRLKALQNKPLNAETTQTIQTILDPYCLAEVHINPEARVKITQGAALPRLMQNGWTSFLVKVKNEAGVTAKLQAESGNAQPVLHMTSYPVLEHTKPEHLLNEGQVANRFIELQMYNNRPLSANLSGLALEYAVVQIYTKDSGKREAEIGFNIGQGTQDIGFRSNISVLFNILPAVKVNFQVEDHDGSPTMASFTVTDGIERVIDEPVMTTSIKEVDYRLTTAQMEFRDRGVDDKIPPRLTGIYPLPSRRVAAFDEYPDFFFQPQIYRSHGEHILLPPGKFNVRFTRGPEYQIQTQEIIVPEGADSITVSFKLKRWVDMAKLGWYSADHHVHAAGCSHYESPEEGVKPEDMWRQIVGEDLNVGAVLGWGPGWYYQKQFFTGKTHPLSTKENVMRYDIEVSGFPSSHAGHVVLLNLREDDYTGTTKIDEWPSWTMPVFKWAKSQNAVTGYAHSGWGLEPIYKTRQLPHYIMPKMDGIGANEYIVTVTENVVDFFSAGDTPPLWELNMWYHTLNCGFKTRLSGETDYPCIYDERVGLARSYFKPQTTLDFDNYITAIKNGRSYVSEGGSHIIDFSVNGLEAGTKNSELKVKENSTMKINARVVALLPAEQDENGAMIAQRAEDKQPYWSIERARIGKSRNVPVELIVNGEAVATTEIQADGNWKDVSFNYTIKQSSWVALRIYPSSHTNPVFVLVNAKPIQVKKSAKWCREVVDQCWKMKKDNIREAERNDAAAAYDKARAIYDKIIKESSE